MLDLKGTSVRLGKAGTLCNEPGFLVVDPKGKSVRLVKQGHYHYLRE